MTKRILFAVSASLCAFTAGAATWTHTVGEYGLRSARTEGRADFGSAHVSAALVLNCHPADDGAVAWELQLHDAKRLAEFGLEDFEGPDAIAGDKVLSEVAAEGGAPPTTKRAAAAGFFGAGSPDTFVLSIAAPSKKASDPALLADTIGPETAAIVWTVQSLKAPGAKLVARFDAEGATAALRETMAGCGPAPEIEVAELESRQDRAPAESGLWTLRPLEWRLKSLLGRDYAGFAERMRDAPALRREGEVWYVIAQPAQQDAAVLLFNASGDVEVVRANPGGIKRDRLGAGKLQAPAAVRDAILATR